MEQVKTISVLLTRHYDLCSNFIYMISGRGYTHASIALDNNYDCFYSFNFRGFSIEHPGKRKKVQRQRKSICYHFTVSEAVYEDIKERISKFIDKQNEYQYSQLGLFLCILRIPHQFRKQYFCSRFVAEILTQSGAVSLKRHSSLYLPNQFVKELESDPGLFNIICNTV